MSSCCEVKAVAVTAPDRQLFVRRAKFIAGASVAYNLVEAAVALSAGAVASSRALVGFGLDSLVEVSSGLIVLWQFSRPLSASREQRAMRMMAVAFFALALFVGFESGRALVTSHVAESSIVGIVLAAVSLVVMPFLSFAQRHTGRKLASNTVVADATQTMLCVYLSAVLLVGLVFNAAFGWWWADPVAGLIIAAVAAKEGVSAWKGDGCCGPSVPTDLHEGCSDKAEPSCCETK